jgi:two-component system sensor histidine kinase DctS
MERARHRLRPAAAGVALRFTTTPCCERRRSYRARHRVRTPSEPIATARAALAALGDSVAVIGRKTGALCWASEAWCARVPGIEVGAGRAALERALPGLKAAVSHRETATAPRRVRLGDAQQWDAEIARLDEEHLLLRVIDWREQSRAMQRQLDDRERLLFTSRVFSVGEMAATTLAHELNQPIGATANLLRGLRSRLARRANALNAEESQALERALEQVMFAARVISRIREFTHSHQPRHTQLDLVALVHASASLLDWDMQRSGARLRLELPGRRAGAGDEVMLQRVVVNLMRNALDAMRSDHQTA